MANITRSKSKKMHIKIAHSLSDAIAGVSELSQRLLLATAWQATNGNIDERRVVRIKLADIAETSGGAPRALYKSAKKLAKEIRAMSYVVVDNGLDSFIDAGVVGGDIHYSEGEFAFQLTERALGEIIDIKTKYTLIHLKNVRRCRGRGQVSLYLNLAQWDQRGRESIAPGDLGVRYAAGQPAKAFLNIVKPFMETFAKTGISCEVEGIGKKTIWHFSWRPAGFHNLGHEPGLAIPYSEADETAMKIQMMLARHGVMDKNVRRRLMELPHVAAWDIVLKCCEEAPHKPGVIHPLLLGEIAIWKDGQAPEQIAARRKEAQLAREAIEVQARDVAAEAAAADAAWLASATDAELEAAAAKVEAAVAKHYRHPGASIREDAEASDIFAGVLHAAATEIIV